MSDFWSRNKVIFSAGDYGRGFCARWEHEGEAKLGISIVASSGKYDEFYVSLRSYHSDDVFDLLRCDANDSSLVEKIKEISPFLHLPSDYEVCLKLAREYCNKN